MSSSKSLALFLTASLSLGVGCKHFEKFGSKNDASNDTKAKKAEAPAPTKSLYERLGKEEGISKVVDDFVARGAADKKVNFTRSGHPNEWDPSPANIEKLKKHLVTFIAKAAGGPDNYKGRDMVTAHTGMNISEAEFNALAADLALSLDALKVPAREKNELLTAVAGTKGQIVNK